MSKLPKAMFDTDAKTPSKTAEKRLLKQDYAHMPAETRKALETARGRGRSADTK